MRLLHLGDLHLGKSVNEFSMIEDQRYILNRVLEIVQEQKVDGLLIAGDVYDKSIPSEEAVSLLDWFLCSMVELKVPVYMISGNHDSDERLNFGSRFFEAKGIYIAAKYEGHMMKCELCDSYGMVNIYLLPFIKASRVKHFHEDAKIENYNDAVRTVIAQADVDPSVRNVLVAHQFVVGSFGGEETEHEIWEDDADLIMPELAGSEGSSASHVGTVECVSSASFDLFDYVALGHIHSPQKVGRDTVRYAGSPLKYSLSEIYREKSVPLITLGAKGDVEVELLPLRPMRDMRHLTGTMEQILDPAHVADPQDYVYVTLTNDEILLDAMSRVRQVYPNAMKLDYRNRHTAEVEDVDFRAVTREKNFAELAAEFYEKMYGCEISEKELEILEEIAETVGLGGR